MPSAANVSRALRSRALVALTATALLATLVVVAGARVAGSARPLPEVSPDELLGSVTEALSDPPPVSGEIVATVELGLPEEALRGVEGGTSEFTGDQRLRVWKSADGLRIAQLGPASERAFVTNGEEVWTWDSRTAEATRSVAPNGQAPEQIHGFLRGLTSGDPVEMAQRALAAVEDTTEVTVEGSAVVAGRDAYRLLIVPRTDETLIDRIEIDVDAEQRVPLRGAVYSRNAAEPSIESAFTSVSFDPIDPEVFTFSPPPGAEVREAPGGREPRGGPSSGMLPGPSTPGSPHAEGKVTASDRVRTVGEDWTTVVAVRQDRDGAASAPGVEGTAPPGVNLEEFLPFSGPLFSARAEQVDGQRWLLLGAVEQDTLERAAQALQ